MLVTYRMLLDAAKQYEIKAGDELFFHFHKDELVRIEHKPREWMYIHEYLNITSEECDNLIDQWNDSADDELSLYEFLRIPWEDFQNLR